MKKIVSLLFLTALLLTSCTGDQGPMGPPGNTGNPGLDGKIIPSSAFRIDINFNATNGFEHTENYGFEVYPSDVALVYILWETTPNGDEVWRLLPQTVRFTDGSDLIYNFDFSQIDVRFFLDGTTDLTTLASQWRQRTFRVIVVPADNVDGMDVSDINTIIQAANIESFDIK